MSAVVDRVALQLTSELGATAQAMGGVVGVEVESGFAEACARLAAELCSEDKDIAERAMRVVMAARWPQDTEPVPWWWRTPAGRVVAATVGRDDVVTVTQKTAAAMLGVCRGTVAQMVRRKHPGLVRDSRGRITRASVLALLARKKRRS